MLWTPGAKNNYRVLTNGGIVGSATPWTGVASGASSEVYGSVVELISAAGNDQDSWGIMVMVSATGASATIRSAVVDILIGGATDDILIPRLLVGYRSLASGPGAACYFFPIHVPAGLRIAAQHVNVNAGAVTARVAVWLYGGGVPPFRVGRKVTALGTGAANSRGQAVTPTASGGAASVTQMIASTVENYFAFLPGFQCENDTTITPAGWVNVGIGIGAATEQRIGTWWFGKETAESMNGPFPCLPAFVEVPAGTRITMLASNSGANDAAYGGHVYAVS